MHQLAGIDAETASQLEQVVQIEVALTALDLAQERPMDADLMGHRLLTKPKGMASVADSLAEDLGGWGEWLCHATKPIRLDYLCPERAHPMSVYPNRPYLDTVPIHGG